MCLRNPMAGPLALMLWVGPKPLARPFAPRPLPASRPGHDGSYASWRAAVKRSSRPDVRPPTQPGTGGGPSPRRRAARARGRGTAARSARPAARARRRRRGTAPRTPAAASCEPPAACRVSMWKNTASPGSSAQPTIGASRSIDVGQLLEAALGEPLRLVVHERARHEPRAEVRAGDELERRLARHGVDGHPHAAGLAAVDVVVRLVLVPRRRLRVPASLTSRWSWKRRTCCEPISRRRSRRPPSSRMNCSYSGIRCQLQKSSKKRPGSSGRGWRRCRAGWASARLRSMPALDQRRPRRRERAAHANGAVAAVVGDELGSEVHGHVRPSLVVSSCSQDAHIYLKIL